jgi:uncharacterized protein
MMDFFLRLLKPSSTKARNVARHGKWKEYNRYGALVAEGNYNKGLRDGIWRIYNEHGQLVIEEEYVDGSLHGNYKAFHENGKPFSVGHYSQNQRDGEFRIFREDGILNKILRFSNGELKEVTEMYNPRNLART